MSKLVVKDNVLIDASYNLDMVEQRLILLAIVEARETGKGISHDTLLQVHASSYINSCLLYTSPSPRDRTRSRMPSSA